MKTTRKYKGGGMNSFTIGISDTLQLQVTHTEDGLRRGWIVLGCTLGGPRIMLAQREVRATAQAFALLADLLDAEQANE